MVWIPCDVKVEARVTGASLYPRSVPGVKSLQINDLKNQMVHSTLVRSTPNEVGMTARAVLDALTPLVQDLSHDLPDDERYRRLLSSLRSLFPADQPRCCGWTATRWCRSPSTD
jgi:hypothetical protein